MCFTLRFIFPGYIPCALSMCTRRSWDQVCRAKRERRAWAWPPLTVSDTRVYITRDSSWCCRMLRRITPVSSVDEKAFPFSVWSFFSESDLFDLSAWRSHIVVGCVSENTLDRAHDISGVPGVSGEGSVPSRMRIGFLRHMKVITNLSFLTRAPATYITFILNLITTTAFIFLI